MNGFVLARRAADLLDVEPETLVNAMSFRRIKVSDGNVTGVSVVRASLFDALMFPLSNGCDDSFSLYWVEMFLN